MGRIAQYELRDELGRGGSAVVYRAVDTALAREVALKLLRHAPTEASRERFLREARAAARLRHPNLVTVYEVGETDEGAFIAMELVEGRPLDLKRPLRETVATIAKVARALDDVHRSGVVHRDMKPANVLVDARGEPHVLDFGLAMLADAAEMTRTGTTIGTPMYMSPEQVSGRTAQIGPHTDVYSLGAMLYEAMAGRAPHASASVAEIFRKTLVEDAPPPPGPADLATICLKAIARQPSQRYATAGAFADDLRRHLSSEPVEARRRWRRRQVQLAIAAVAAVLIGAGAWALHRRDAAARTRLATIDTRRPLRDAISEARAYLYIPGDGILEKMRAVEAALAALEALPDKDAEAWALLGEGWYFAGDLRRAEEALARADRADPRVAFLVARLQLELAMAELMDMDGPPEVLAKARERCARAMQALPQSAGTSLEAWVVAAVRAYAEADVPRMRRLCEEGLARFGDVPGTEDLLLLQAWAAHEDRGAYCDRALSRRPHYPWAQLLRSHGRSTARDYAGAIADIDAALAMTPRFAAGWVNRGAIRNSMGDWRGAIADFDEALRLNATHIVARVNRAALRMQNGDMEGGEQDFETAIRESPHDPRGWVGRAGIRLNRGDIAGALDACEDALRVGPKCADALAIRGGARLMRGDLHGALADFDAVIAGPSPRAAAYGYRGQIYKELGRLDDAIADYTRAIEIGPPNPMYYGKRAIARWERGDSDAALADVNEALRLAPEYPEALQNRAVIRFRRDDWDGAIADCDVLLRLYPDRVSTLWLRGKAHVVLGHREEAIADIERTLALAPAGWVEREDAEKLLAKIRR